MSDKFENNKLVLYIMWSHSNNVFLRIAIAQISRFFGPSMLNISIAVIFLMTLEIKLRNCSYIFSIFVGNDVT